MENETDNQRNNRPWLWKKGQSGNLAGRPKGKSMKEYSREYLASMTEDERQEFLAGIPKVEIWRLAEGNPANATELTGKDGTPLFLPSEALEKYNLNDNSSSDTKGGIAGQA